MEMQPGKSGYLNSVLPFLDCRWLHRKPEEESGRNTALNQIFMQGIVASSLLLKFLTQYWKKATATVYH